MILAPKKVWCCLHFTGLLLALAENDSLKGLIVEEKKARSGRLHTETIRFEEIATVPGFNVSEVSEKDLIMFHIITIISDRL